MPKPPSSMPRRFRVLALDVDGTIADADGSIRAETRAAISRAAAAGIRPVLCTGRRYRRALPIAERLELDAPLVCNSGAIVKEPARHETVWRADFDQPLLREILDVFRDREEPIVSFTDLGPDEPDFVVNRAPSGRDFFDEYLSHNLEHARIDPDWPDGDSSVSRFHLCAIGPREAMLDFQTMVEGRVGGRVRTFVQKSPRYVGTMCEVLRSDASKWTALGRLAELWGVDRREICAVGDDMNDVPMLEGAGLGVAMPHAPAEVRNAAGMVLGDEPEALARFIDGLLGG